MIDMTIAKRFPAKLLGIALRTSKRTLFWSLTILWLLFFVLVLIPVAWLAFTILAHR
jgi:hypothetical protein